MRTRAVGTIMQAGMLLGLCVACATTDPLVVDFSGVTTRESLNDSEGCAVKIIQVIDERNSREDLGMLGSHVVEGQHVMPWLQHAVRSLNLPGAEALDRKGNQVNARSLDIHVGLTQLYVHSLQSSFAANILLKVQYRLDQAPTQSHRYRGTDVNVNWTGSADALLSLFNNALEDVLRRMRTDITRICQGIGGR